MADDNSTPTTHMSGSDTQAASTPTAQQATKASSMRHRGAAAGAGAGAGAGVGAGDAADGGSVKPAPPSPSSSNDGASRSGFPTPASIMATCDGVWRVANDMAKNNHTMAKVAGQVGVKPGVVPLTVVVTAFVVAWLVFGPVTLVGVYGFVIPLYKSSVALHTPHKRDDKYWLTYWVVFSLLTMLESVAQWTVSWIPVYWAVKATFVTYLMFFNGAAVVFEQGLRPAATQVVRLIFSGHASSPASATGATEAKATANAKAKAKAAATNSDGNDNDNFVLRT